MSIFCGGVARVWANSHPLPLFTRSASVFGWVKPPAAAHAVFTMASENSKAAIGQDFQCVPDINDTLQQVRWVVVVGVVVAWWWWWTVVVGGGGGWWWCEWWWWPCGVVVMGDGW